MDTIGHLADNDDARVVIANERAVTLLIEALHSGSNAEKGLAAYALGRLTCDNKPNSLAAEAGGAISDLVDLLVVETSVEKTFAPYAYTCLGASGICIGKEDSITGLVGLLRDGSIAQKEGAAATLGWYCESEADAWIIVKQGAVPLLIEFVQSSSDEMKTSASATLSSLATIGSICAVLEEEGVIAPLIKLLSTGNEEQKRNAASALANVAVNSANYSEEIMEDGGLDPLVEILRHGTGELLDNAVFVVGCIASCSRRHNRAVEKLGMGPLLVNMLHGGDLELKDHAAFALERLSRASDATLTAMTEDSVISDLIELLRTGKEFGQQFAAIDLVDWPVMTLRGRRSRSVAEFQLLGVTTIWQRCSERKGRVCFDWSR